MDISEVVKRTGLAASTIRFYEEKGLIQSVGRHAQRRLFGPDILDRLALFMLGRAAGFSLQEMAAMLNAQGEPEIDRQMLLRKARELDATIGRLKAVRDGLKHAANCPESSHLVCPTFQRLMRAASSGDMVALTPGPNKKL
ncbi:MAG TPA: helix-turn-helix domain-containing protein [Comamonas sp.]